MTLFFQIILGILVAMFLIGIFSRYFLGFVKFILMFVVFFIALVIAGLWT